MQIKNKFVKFNMNFRFNSFECCVEITNTILKYLDKKKTINKREM